MTFFAAGVHIALNQAALRPSSSGLGKRSRESKARYSTSGTRRRDCSERAALARSYRQCKRGFQPLPLSWTRSGNCSAASLGLVSLCNRTLIAGSIPPGSTSEKRNRKPLMNCGWSRSNLRYALGPRILPPLPSQSISCDPVGSRPRCAPGTMGQGAVDCMGGFRHHGADEGTVPVFVVLVGDPGMMSNEPGDWLGRP